MKPESHNARWRNERGTSTKKIDYAYLPVNGIPLGGNVTTTTVALGDFGLRWTGEFKTVTRGLTRQGNIVVVIAASMSSLSAAQRSVR